MLDVNTNLFFREYNTLEHEILNTRFLELDVLTWLEKIAWTIIVVMIQMHFSLYIFLPKHIFVSNMILLFATLIWQDMY